ncbi:hypothetical protein [Azohydromonas australica]|uniref:hypothetical protein n=1 Tax=Azohydromonas australica TaxID=364039 RepID=UPI000407E8DB|nr:hypothetical protein [Azohydromonas australica]
MNNGSCLRRGNAFLTLLGLLGAGAAAAPPPTIVDLQRWRVEKAVPLQGNARYAGARLVNLNPSANAWFVLTLTSAPAKTEVSFHLENADPGRQQVRLDAADGGTLVLSAGGQHLRCAPWNGDGIPALQQARNSALPFAPLCEGRLYLRNPVSGHRTSLEATTEFLRDHVWGGERIVQFARREFFPDAFIEHGRAASAPATPASNAAMPQPLAPAATRAGLADPVLVPQRMALDIEGLRRGLTLGSWYAVRGLAGVHFSLYQAAALPDDASGGAQAWRPDEVEAGAMAYLVAFDLSQFDLGFSLGTEHPRLGWSPRALPAVRDASLPGPDGLATAAPLVRTGMLSPGLQPRVAATFTGGFKREHGAFRYGALAQRHHGSHYGFIEQGTLFSSLVPGLATLYVLDNGEVGMKTWSDADGVLLPRIRDARQNGVPLVEAEAAEEPPRIGALVNQWGPGNWSGSAQEELRSLRAGACLLQHGGRRHLAYGYFSAATPMLMARVFQAYGCRYAMHLDMNALEHTYLALYVHAADQVLVQHLIDGMGQFEKRAGNGLLTRFMGYSDDRDFFYLLRKEPSR